MRIGIGVAMILMTGGGCWAGDNQADDGGGSVPCSQLVEDIRARLPALDRSCDRPEDCVLIGAAVDRSGYHTCNCAFYYAPSCEGIGVHRGAVEADSALQAMVLDFYDRCLPAAVCFESEIPYIWDCPPAQLSCVNQRCITTSQSCFPEPDPDAGVR